jgi:hypothetical protein
MPWASDCFCEHVDVSCAWWRRYASISVDARPNAICAVPMRAMVVVACCCTSCQAVRAPLSSRAKCSLWFLHVTTAWS